MENYKRVLFSITSIALIFVSAILGVQFIWKYQDRCDLNRYYSRELERVYTQGYAVDKDGDLIWTQYQFETAIKDLKDQMIKDDFNKEKIERMHDEGRKKGQQTRRFWDEARKSDSLRETLEKTDKI